jgi:hypothetical protein
MMKPVVPFVVGLALGGTVVWLGRGATPLESPGEMVKPVVLSCESTAAPLQARVSQLEEKLNRQVASDQAVTRSVAPDQASDENTPSSPDGEDGDTRLRESTRWRVSAIEKFVPLSEDQKQRLSDKFMKEGNSEDGEAETESLEAILGEESASFYRQQVKAAFERVQDEETEKEVVWVSRQLSLSPEQERAVRDVYLRVEQQVQVESAGEGHGSAPKSSQDRVRLMVQEGRLRNSLRQSMLKDVLTPEQYTTYLKNESESASSEMEVFHDPGGH